MPDTDTIRTHPADDAVKVEQAVCPKCNHASSTWVWEENGRTVYWCGNCGHEEQEDIKL